MPLALSLILPLLGALGYEYVPWWGNLLLVVWIWCLGANVGSFMNVVVFRLPAGMSIVRPGSRCPKCGQAIRWFDNVPIISWLWLRARCRGCGLPISGRYPLVETLVAAIFLALALVGPPRLGGNLPYVREFGPVGADLSLWLIYVLHVLLLTTLVCAALIRFDGHATPCRLYVPGLLVALLGPWLWGLAPLVLTQLRWTWIPLHPVAFHTVAGPKGDLLPPAGELWTSICGIVAGATLGLIAAGCGAPRRRRLLPQEVPAVALCGGALGWQAVGVLAATASLLDLVAAVGSRWLPAVRRLPWTGHLALATFVLLVSWSFWVSHFAFLGMHATFAAFTGAALVTACAAACASSLALPAPWHVPGPEASDAEAALLPGHAAASVPLAHHSRSDSTTTDPWSPSPMTHSPEGDLAAILRSPSFRLAEDDTEFLKRPALRPVRLQLELLKPEMILTEQRVYSTIVVFGGTQVVERAEAESRLADARQRLSTTPDDPRAVRAVARAESVLAKAHYYDAAREFSRLVSASCQVNGDCEFVVVTGGGPGIMEAANRGAHDIGAKSIGLNITLPEEQVPNPYITPELCFQFHYFALRKMHFLLRAKALVVFPGGFGTLDELFNALTLRQTNCMQPIPIILYGRDYWQRVVNFQFLADEGVIADEHLDLLDYAETPQQAWEIITRFHGHSSTPTAG